MQAANAGRNQDFVRTRAPTAQGRDEEGSPKPQSGTCTLCCQSRPCRAVLIALGTSLVLTGFAGIALSLKLNFQDSAASFGIPVSGVAIFVGIVLIFCSYGLKVQSNEVVTETQTVDRSGRRPVTVRQGGGSSITPVLEMSRVSAGAASTARQRLVAMQDARRSHLACLCDSNQSARPTTATAGAVHAASRLSRVAGRLPPQSADYSSRAVVGSRPTAGGVTEGSAQSPSYNFHSASIDQFRPTLDLHHGLVSEQETALNIEAPPYVSVALMPTEIVTAAARLSDSSSQLLASLPQRHTTIPVPSYEQALLISEPVSATTRDREISPSFANSAVEQLPRSGATPSALRPQLPPPPSYDEVYSRIIVEGN